MPSTYGPPWNWGPAGRRGPTVNPNLRVSDADRAHVADQLSKHYSEGRLDQAEFNERLERATNARTQADLAGLLDDLPAEPPPAAAVPPRTRPPYQRLLFLLLLVVLIASTWHLLFHSFFFILPIPWLLLGLVAFLLLRRRSWHRHRGGPC